MAGKTSDKKPRKSQKRKDRQERRRKKQAENAEQPITQEPKRVKKSLPGFLAKNSKNIVKWLDMYCVLFCRADNYGIDRLDLYSEAQRRELVQTYVDIREFQRAVVEMLNANDIKNSEMLELAEKTEIKNEPAETAGSNETNTEANPVT